MSIGMVMAMALASPDFSAATFSDPLLGVRLRILTTDLEKRPGCALPQACRSPAALKGAYRFLAHPAVGVANLLPAFLRPGIHALARQRAVIVPHDTTTFNFSHLESASGLGFINDSETARGIHLHSSLLLDRDGNLVGIAALQFWVRAQFRAETDAQVRQLPIEAKESHKWLRGMRAVHEAFAAVTDTPPRVIHVMDREGDIHEVFQEVRQLGADAVIRCAQDRRVEGDACNPIDYSKKRVAAQAALGTMTIRVPRQTGGYRQALVEVRALDLRLRPHQGKHKSRRPVALGLIEIREISAPPAGEAKASWWLWTTLRVRRVRQVKRVLQIYKARWRLEDYHRALKTGCQVEKLRLPDGDKLMKALAIQAYVATRVVRIRDCAKSDPEQDCAACFSADEWQLLFARQQQRPWRPADGQPTLGAVVKWLARLGGHQGRANDPCPGAECLAKALYALDLLLQGRDLGIAQAAVEQHELKETKPQT